LIRKQKTMKAVRRWLIYRRLVKELTEAPRGSLSELGTCGTSILEFAWQCAHLEAERTSSARRQRRDA
jgi:hypothetical protein